MRIAAALLATALPLTANGKAQVLPAGQFKARDGRPGPGKFWQLDDAAGVALAAKLSASAARTPISIDYEHQTVHAKTNGQPAPSSGHMLSFDWQPGKGMYADVRWTPRAKAYIDAEEYAWISPVLLTDAADQVVGLYNAALVSAPALDGMDAVQVALQAMSFGGEPTTPTTPSQEPSVTLLAALIAGLGLPADTTQDKALATVATLKVTADAASARPVVPVALATALALQPNADEATAVAALNARLQQSATLISGLQTQVTTLSADLQQARQADAKGELDALIATCLADGRVVPATEKLWRDLGTKDLAQCKVMLAAQPPTIQPGGSQTQGKPPGGAAAAGGDATKVDMLSDQAFALARQMGIGEEAWRKLHTKAA